MKKISRFIGISIFAILMMAIVPLNRIVRPVNLPIVADYGDGYIVEIAPGKYKMHLEGDPYEMGYQQGYMGPESVQRLASEDWFKNIVSGLLDAPDAIFSLVLKQILDYERLLDVVGSVVNDSTLRAVTPEFNEEIDSRLDKLLVLVRALIAHNSIYVPAELLTECQGVADGATDAGYIVSYDDVLLLNMGMDALLTLSYPVVRPMLHLLDSFAFQSCSGYIAQGSATTTGQTIMGRHYQFSSYVLHEEMMMIEYYPDTGYKFISTNAPGFVGLTSAMNEMGIGIGQDMIPAEDCSPANYGMGTLFTARYIAQTAGQYSEAINIVTSNLHGCSWIYGIGDGRNGETGGCALETSAHHYRIRNLGYERPWWAFFSFDTIEEKSDLITWSNHFIYRGMNFWSNSYTTEDSLVRYSWLTNEALDMYGTIDLDTGATLMDYLHPPNYGYYYNPNGPVEASITAWDLTNLEAKALFGHYDDDWVVVSL